MVSNKKLANIKNLAKATLLVGAISGIGAHEASAASNFRSLGTAGQLRSALMQLNKLNPKNSRGIVFETSDEKCEGDKCTEGKCGEGKCGDEGDKGGDEGKCGEGKCG